ncbi:MAG: glycosyl transferase [Bacteroidaceae bacterium]|nr:glycosyl transferase [Bacteroidaceae bacterium]
MEKQSLIYRVKRKLLHIAAPLMSDRLFLKCLFRIKMGYNLNLENPQTFNEKLQWLKLYDRRPEYTKMVDKVEAKEYVANIIGDEYIIPTLAVYDCIEDIDFDALPRQFVMKCTHDSGGIIICRNKDAFDRKAAIRKLTRGLKKNYFLQNREWPYKNIKPRIIVEQYMTNSIEPIDELSDYKWFCFDGEPKAMFIATDRFLKGEETKFDFYDTEFRHLPFTNGHPNATKTIVKPHSFDAMKSLATKLSQGLPQVRVDFYDVNGHIYFGELTFFHWSGLTPFEPIEWDYKFGEYLKLPKKCVV